jgi:hypothetical protein
MESKRRGFMGEGTMDRKEPYGGLSSSFAQAGTVCATVFGWVCSIFFGGEILR